MATTAARSATRGFLALAAAALLAMAVVAGLNAWRDRSALGAREARGARLFDGREPLLGTLAGHAAPLPSGTVRCSQCHAGPDAAADAPGATPLGPMLDRDHLRQALSRRNGPPTAYDLAAFCRALRVGIDPAHVTLPRAMPRFEIDDAGCDALWTHLTRTPKP